MIQTTASRAGASNRELDRLATKAALGVEDRLRVLSVNGPEIVEPTLRRAKPILISWNELITLMDGTDAEGNNLGALAKGSRINWRSASWAESQLTLFPAFSRLEISFQRAREERERTFFARHHGAKSRA